MADALCGPSNALQSFQKHSTVDRTLQQDRLTARQLPSQGFRSSPGPSAGFLDPEFEAFQAGQIPLQHPEPQLFSQAGLSALHTPPSFNSGPPAAWANDFHKLSITGAPPGFQQTNYAQQLQARPLGEGWQSEFAQQQNQSTGPSYSTHAGYNVPLERLSSIAQMPQNLQPLRMPPMQAEQEVLTRPQRMEEFDEEAFARAFDAVAQSELALAQDQSTEVQSEVLVNESAERLMVSGQSIEQQRLGADLIHDPREGEQSQTQDDPDALARTAGQLLDSVKDNQSEKFQNSQFLELMRQLRDREVTVEGDKIVGVQSQERDAIEKSLYSIARQLSLLDFRRVEPLLASHSHSHSLQDQLVIGAFVRTLMHISAQLDSLARTYPDQDLIHRSKPFGMHIGVEVFALAANPLLDTYPALKSLVLSFKAQFTELGIDPHMVRRASTASPTTPTHTHNKTENWNESKHGHERERERENSPSSAAEQELRDWLDVWLATTPAQGPSCLVCPRQLRQLLGPELAAEGAPTRPTQEHVDRVVDILGRDVVECMMRVMEKGSDGDGAGMSFGDFAAMVSAFREGEGAEAVGIEAEMGEGRVALERVFPALAGEWGV